MRLVRFTTLDHLAPWAAAWNRLAGGVPFRAWEWLSAWWRCYGQADTRAELNVLGVFAEDGTLVGVAPWFLHRSRRLGWTIRFLGTGEVCSDYLAILAAPGLEDAVAETLAEWLVEQNRANVGRPSQADQDDLGRPSNKLQNPSGGRRDSTLHPWDLFEVSGVEGTDRTTKRLIELLALHGHAIHSRPATRCWRVNLPEHWDTYEAMLSHSHRKQVRRLNRQYLATGRAQIHTVTRAEELERAAHFLIDLHQRRQRAVGQPGCFASDPFREFHLAVMPWLLQTGRLRLHWLELDGRPIAAEYHIAGEGVVYAYQAGIEPDALEHEPGRLATMATLQAAIERGYSSYDFLRGDEPYKAHWRAEPRRLLEVCVVPDKAAARFRYGVWTAGKSVKQWIKGRLAAR